MKNKIHVLLLIAFSFLSACNHNDEPDFPTTPTDGRIALSYVAYYRSSMPDPTYLTHINYAFAELYMKDGEYQKFAVQGKKSRFDSVKRYVKSKNPNIKFLISFTNSTDHLVNSGGFSQLVKSPEMRRKFAEDCKQFLIEEDIDGVDMNWEFPGMTWGSTEYDTKNDVKNYTLLIKELREVLGKDYLLTYAGYCRNKRPTNDDGYKYIDVKAVEPYVDYVNIMTYDFDAAPNHNAAWKDSDSYWDCERTINEYLSIGATPSKLVLGIPFYGRTGWGSNGAHAYNSIIKLKASDGYKIDNWNESCGVAYVTKDGKFYCSYDNAKSIGIKGDKIRKLGLRGMMAWEYNLDDDEGTLRKALWNAVMK